MEALTVTHAASRPASEPVLPELQERLCIETWECGVSRVSMLSQCPVGTGGVCADHLTQRDAVHP